MKPARILTYSAADLLTVSLVAALVAGWAARAQGALSWPVLLICEAQFFAFYLVGSLVAACNGVSAGLRFDLPLRLLAGYAILNTAQLVLAWLSPLGMLANFCCALVPVFFFYFVGTKRERARDDATHLWGIALCAVAATLWCQDSIRPIQHDGGRVLFKPWVDGFYHAVQIRIFAASHGASTIEDFRLAGVAARPYHYGMYMLPALVKQASGISAYTAFAGILAPVGVFFSGLAAYSFFASLWGSWSGVAAAAALLLLPDGAQQGMQNPFMSYHWLTQISPSATYGLSLLALAWLFVIRACVAGNRAQVVVGWSLAAVCTFYKLHFVVASALLLLLIPALFFRGLSRLQSAVCTIAGCVAYVASLVLVQKVPGVPLIRFDGSSVGEVLRLIQSFAVPGRLREYAAHQVGPKLPWTSNLFFGVPYVLIAIFGLGAPLVVVVASRLRGRTPLLYVVFPLLLTANFLAMFFGLALDFDSSTPDELSHRPLMIVYFFVVGWLGGALGLVLSEAPRLRGLAPRVILGISALLLAVPAMLGPGVQRMWAMPKLSPLVLPKDVVEVAEHLRAHSAADDVFQDSQFDRIYAIAALSERRAFVAHTMTRIDFHSEMIEARSNAVEHLMSIRQPKLVGGTARALGIRWFVLEPGDRVDWPSEIAANPAVQMGPLKVYEF